MTPDFRIYLISDRRCVPRGLIWNRLEKILRAGSCAFQLREKDLPDRRLYAMAIRARALTRRHGCRLLINGRWDIAKAVGADGVHLPQDSLPIPAVRKALGKRALIGKSTHSLAQAMRAQKDGADFITFGPVFDTPSKRSFGPPLGLLKLQKVCAEISIPVFALGGITEKNTASVLEKGAWGIAARIKNSDSNLFFEFIRKIGCCHYLLSLFIYAGTFFSTRAVPHMAQLPL